MYFSENIFWTKIVYSENELKLEEADKSKQNNRT